MIIGTPVSAEIPASSRTNYFTALVGELAGKFNAEKGVSAGAKTVVVPTAKVGTAKSQIQGAAHALETKRTPKYNVTEVEGTENSNVTFWLVSFQARAHKTEVKAAVKPVKA